MFHNPCINRSVFRPKNTFISENAGDEKNLHPGGRKFIFLIDFPEIFSFLFYFIYLFFLLFSYSCFFACLFLEIKDIYSDTHSTMQASE